MIYDLRFTIWKFQIVAALAIISTLSYSAKAQPASLAGQWRFALDRKDAGVGEQWFTRELADKINLPGALQAQGYGDEISTNTPWVLSLYDKNWFLRADYTNYTKPGAVKVPFLCQPPRHYLGAAWYQRDIEIPQGWQDRRVVLFLERPHCESRVWLDDQLIGTNNSLCAPHEFELGVSLKPGKHRLTVRVDNRVVYRGPDQHAVDAHSVSDSLGQSWNGIVGKMELRSTSLVWIEDAQFFSNTTNKSARLTLKIKNLTKQSGTGKLTVASDSGYYIIRGRPDVHIPEMSVFLTKELTWSNDVNNVECNVDFGSEAKLWSEFNPALQKMELCLDSNFGKDCYKTFFGIRDLRTSGTQLTLNGKPIFLRGTHHGGDFPLTGYPPTDVAYWRKTFQTVKDWGLNHVRFHSFCPPEAAFEAADELGLYLQIEPGTWNTFSPGSAMDEWLYAETERILKAYGNHPSFVLFSPSNEPKGRWKESLPKWAEHFRAEDPRRLYTTGTGFTDPDSPGPLDKVDYTSTGRFGGARIRGESGWFGRDYSRALQGVNIPVLTHEDGQWIAYPDYDVIKKFTGYLRPGNYEIFRDSAQAHGVLEMKKQFAFASGRYQLACYKEEIEANLRTPGLSGFQLLDLHDYVGQGTALVGLLDTFWEGKNYVKADEFKQFCNTTVPLAWLKKRVFTTDEKLEADIGVAHFGKEPLTKAVVRWEVRDETGKVVGVCPSNPVTEIPVGFKGKRLSFTLDLDKLPAPARYRLVALVDSSEGNFENSWNFWLYPSKASDAPVKDVLVTSSWDDAEAKLKSGGRVLFLPRNADLAWDCPPLDVVPVFWNRLMSPGWGRMLGLWCDTNHPALAGFPTEANCDWQWTQITRGARPINLEKLPRGLQPVVSAIDDWNRNWKLGAIFEAQVGAGKLLVSAFDLSTDLNSHPVARQLRRSLLDYAASEKFQPKTEISVADFRSLYFDSRIMRKLGAKAAGDGADASAAIDGDPNSAWIAGSNRRVEKAAQPHELIVTFPASVAMNGVVILPRQNDRDHTGDVKNFSITTSADGTNWNTAAQGELASTWSPQTIAFGKTLSAKQLRFTALSGFGADTVAAIAELAVVYAGPKLAANDSDNVEYRRSRSTSTDVDEGTEMTNRTNVTRRTTAPR